MQVLRLSLAALAVVSRAVPLAPQTTATSDSDDSQEDEEEVGSGNVGGNREVSFPALLPEGLAQRGFFLPLACLDSKYMMWATNLTLDMIQEIGATDDCRTKAAQGNKDLGALHERIARLQQGSVCGPARLVKFEPFNTGWGGTTHSMLKPLMRTIRSGETLLTPGMPGWTGPECGNTGACIFRTFAPGCEGEDPMQVEARQAELPASEQVKMYGTDWSGADPRTEFVLSQEALLPANIGKNRDVSRTESYFWERDGILPEQFRHRGWYWWTVHLQGYIWRPSKRLQHKLDKALIETGMGEALKSGLVLGMHVRHGDSCMDYFRGRSCTPLAQYMHHAEVLRKKTGVSTIYLATDSDSVVNDTSLFPDWKFIRYPMALAVPKMLQAKLKLKTMYWDEVFRMNAYRGQPDHNLVVAEVSSIDMIMLSMSHLFLGKMTSNFYRTAIELKSAGCDCVPAFQSLDSPWCFDFAVNAGLSLNREGNVVGNWLC